MILSALSRYTHWLHGQWPSGIPEKGPEVAEDGSTRLKGVRVVGDLTGVPLLKFSADTGAKAIRSFLSENDFEKNSQKTDVDVAIIGAGVSGISAAIEAHQAGLNYVVLESQSAFSTIRNFPKAKPIYTYPTEMVPEGQMRFESNVKEALIEELEEQRVRFGIQTEQAQVDHIEEGSSALSVHFSDNRQPLTAQRIVVAIGRTGNFRKLNVPGEELDKVSNRLIDAQDYTGKRVIVVGGGDSALEAAISLAEAGADVSLSYRKADFQRPKPDNIERIQTLASERRLKLFMGSQLERIEEQRVFLKQGDQSVSLENDNVLALIGREPPLEFFRRSRIPIAGERTAKFWITAALSVLFFTLMYHWTKGLWNPGYLNPSGLAYTLTSLGGWLHSQTESPLHFLHHLKVALSQPGFYYSAAYSGLVTAFGIRRILTRKTPYITLQTTSLILIQVIPLFFIPWLLLPWSGAHGWWTSGGIGQWLGDSFWPNGEYWRAFGLVLAWPLFVYNWFTAEPIWGWLILGFIQTFVIIPFIVLKWGKGAYCGWICSCGALAETVGDRHRHKMPHGPFWNKFNMLGQAILAFALITLLFRILGWIFPGSLFNAGFKWLFESTPLLNYKYFVDLWLAGVLGVAFYFHFSGRIWCRFACPLAALMHIYAKFTKFRIFADKKKCISCNACTTVCHQGIDVMNFANKGEGMKDPECVRCSACVTVCPTGTLNFGSYDSSGKPKLERLWASPVQMREAAVEKTPIDAYMEAAAKRVK